MKGVHQRADGVWLIDYRVNGIRARTPVGHGNDGYRRAVRLLRERKSQVALGQHPEKREKTPTFTEFAEDYLRHGDWRPKTREGYESIIRVHLTPAFGKRRLDEITRSMIEAFRTKKKETAVQRRPKGPLVKPTPRTVNAILDVLQFVLAYAVDLEKLKENVALRVKPVESPDTDDRDVMRILQPDQVHQLLEVTDEPYRTLYRAAVSTGMRRGELLGLRWGDIDYGGNRIEIRRQRQRVREGDHYKIREATVKTRTGWRTIELFPDLREALLALPSGDDPERDYVFRNRDGGPLDPDNLDRRFKRDLTLAGISEKIRFHDLRHTHASFLIAAGVHPKAIQARMGHASITTTLNTYGHLMPSAFQGVGAQFDALLNPAHETPRAGTGAER